MGLTATEDTITMSRYRALAAGIIRQAALDVINLPKGHLHRRTAEKFFSGKWFENLADVLDVNSAVLRDILYPKQEAQKNIANL